MKRGVVVLETGWTCRQIEFFPWKAPVFRWTVALEVRCD